MVGARGDEGTDREILQNAGASRVRTVRASVSQRSKATLIKKRQTRPASSQASSKSSKSCAAAGGPGSESRRDARLRGAFSAPARGLQRFARAVRVERERRRRAPGRTPRRRERASFSSTSFFRLNVAAFAAESPPSRGRGAFFAAIAAAFLVMRTTGALFARREGPAPRPGRRARAVRRSRSLFRKFARRRAGGFAAVSPALAERAELALGGLRLAQRASADLARGALRSPHRLAKAPTPAPNA